MHIVYIHGNQASAKSFNFLRTQLTGYKELMLEYDSAHGFYNNHRRMLEQLREFDDIFFIAHSLGGIHALHLANEIPERVVGGITLSTPYGGSHAAQAIQYLLPFSRVIKDIQPRSGPITASNGFKIAHPWTNIVSTKGHSPFMIVANDGVVTQDSMRHREDIALVEVESNHFEIVLSEETAAIIKQAINEIEDDIARRIIFCS